MSVSLVIPIITFAVLGVLLWVVYRTRTGMAMRAVSTDLDAARLQAIDVNRIISFTFGAGSLLAAVGGIMWSYKYPQLNPLMGIMPGLKCFIAAVIGGIGKGIPGAVLGGFLLGGIELLTVAFLPTLTGYRDAFAFVLLIVVLLVKPSGCSAAARSRRCDAMRPKRTHLYTLAAIAVLAVLLGVADATFGAFSLRVLDLCGIYVVLAPR